MLVNEFADMMPHRLRVKKYLGRDDWGQAQYEATGHLYMCLLDENDNMIRTTFGEDIVFGIAAYVFSIPIGESDPVPISTEDKISFEPPPEGQPETRPIDKVDKHYWKDGQLHNMVIKFT